MFRLDRVSSRLNKTTYKGLTAQKRKYVNLTESKRRFELELQVFWRGVRRDEHSRASLDNNWDFYHYAENQLTKINTQIDKLTTKNSWSEQELLDILNVHMQNNLSSGGSF